LSQPNEKRRRFAAIWGKKQALERDESDFSVGETKTHAQICTPPFIRRRAAIFGKIYRRGISAQLKNGIIPCLCILYCGLSIFECGWLVRGRRRRRSCVCVELKAWCARPNEFLFYVNNKTRARTA
jgi:hypothetical protein